MLLGQDHLVQSMSFDACCVIPSRNHYRVVGEIVSRVRQFGLPVFVIDDASDEPAHTVLAGLHAPADGIVVTRLAERGGKGGQVAAPIARQIYQAIFLEKVAMVSLGGDG